jgi:plastocyanin
VTGPGGIRSRTVSERVAVLLSLAASATTAGTNRPLVFSGHVTPGHHSGEQGRLQQQSSGPSGGWKTIETGTIDADSNFSITHDFHTPGAYDVRGLLAADAENAAGSSDPITVTVEQAEHPSFTIESSNPEIDAGESVTVSGTLYAAGATSTPEAGATVTLFGHAHGASYTSLGSTVTGADGGYGFTQAPSRSGSYEVRTSSGPPRSTAQLYEAVREVVTLGVGSPTADVGATITFTGSITPPDPGGVVQLEQMGSDASFHEVGSGTAAGDSSFMLSLAAGSTGTQTFRAVVPGGFADAKGVSPSVTVTVELPPIAALPGICLACPPVVLPRTSTTTAAATVVTVIAGVPSAYAFKLSAAGEPAAVSDKPAVQLSLPAGEVTFDVQNPSSGIVPHSFEICSAPLAGAVTTLGAVQKLPNSCLGTTAPAPPGSLAPGASASVTVDLTTPGTYEYLSTAGGAATGDAFAGMKGVLKVT